MQVGQHREGEGRDDPGRGAVRQSPPATLSPSLFPQVATVHRLPGLYRPRGGGTSAEIIRGEI
jgi:hypothetical protein